MLSVAPTSRTTLKTSLTCSPAPSPSPQTMALALALAAACAGSAAALAPPAVFYDPMFQLHTAPAAMTAAFHPEIGRRTRAIVDRLKLLDEGAVAWKGVTDDPDRALGALRRIHDERYIDKVRAASAKAGDQGSMLDGQTYCNEHTYSVALRAANAWLDGVDHVLDSDTEGPAFAVCRPPSHHAEPSASMGFCVFGSCAAAALYALDHGAKRVAVLDFDVHYGNGIVACLRGQGENVRFVSVHQEDAFPLTADDVVEGGVSAPTQHFRNVGVRRGSMWGAFSKRLDEDVLPWLQELDADLILVAAGYDALSKDPVAQVSLSPRDYAKLADRLKDIWGDKIVFGLEGGYVPDELAEAVEETLRPWLGPRKEEEY